MFGLTESTLQDPFDFCVVNGCPNPANIVANGAGYCKQHYADPRIPLVPQQEEVYTDLTINFDHDSETHPKNLCPTCKRKMPKPKVDSPVEEKKVRKTWAVSVPMDRREDGADVLDELIEASRELFAKHGLDYGEEKSVKYYVLATALGLFVTHGEAIIS